MRLRIYSVMVDPGADPERGIAFVPDRFTVSAFLFPVFWALAYRLWWRALALLALLGLLAWGTASGVSGQIMFTLYVVIALYVGFEAQHWRRAALERRGWYEAAVIAAPSREESERRYFADHARRYAV
jgi:small-conductance mechanosensitive channel